MKRYRCTKFFIDTMRNIPDRNEVKKHVISIYGDADVENRVNRYLSFKPPSLGIVDEYLTLLQEIGHAYVFGLYYPSITAACCLGERILNTLILKLREYYKSSPHYKNVYRKDSFDDWNNSIEILTDWQVIGSTEIKEKFEKLARIRHQVIHFNHLGDIEAQTKDVLILIHEIVRYFFELGMRPDIYFWASGEIYVKKKVEQIPFIKEMILPHCLLVGYKHKIELNEQKQFVMKDGYIYPEGEVSDEDFIQLRIKEKT